MNLRSTCHQVAIAGTVSDRETGQTLHRANVEISEMPDEFKTKLALRAKQYGFDWDTMAERPDRTRTAIDGHFHFLDLPNGKYTLTASLPNAGTRYSTAQIKVEIFRDSQGNLKMASVNIALPPTALRGQVTDSNKNPIIMAKVQVEGSSESAFSDCEGNYFLSGLEASQPPSQQTVKVAAMGFQSTSKSFQISQGTVGNLNFTLQA